MAPRAALEGVLRPRAVLQRSAEKETPAAHLERIKKITRESFDALSPAEQDRELIFLHETRETIVELSETAEKELDRLFSRALLGRMFETYLDADQLLAADKIIRFYRNYKRFDSDMGRMKKIGAALATAPMVHGVYGVGYPFYGDADMEKIIYFIFIKVMRRQLDPDAFLNRILPDIDVIIVFEPLDPERVNPTTVRPGMTEILRENFFGEILPFRRNWAELFANLFGEANVAGGTITKVDPVKAFMYRTQVRLDMVPYRSYVWADLPAFVMAEDVRYFEWLPDLFFTGNPLSGRGLAREEQDVPGLFRRNFLLNMLDRPMTEEEVFDRLFIVSGGRLYLRLWSQVRALGTKKMREATFRAIEEGLITRNKGGYLSRTLLGQKFVQELRQLRRRLLYNGMDKAKYEDWRLMQNARRIVECRDLSASHV